MLACAMLGIDINYACPKGYEPAEDVVERTKALAEKNGSSVVHTTDPVEAVRDAHVVYTDVFISMGEEHLKDKMEAFDGYQVNEAMVSHMDENWSFMHCLPAHRGEEVTDWVMTTSRASCSTKQRTECGRKCPSWPISSTKAPGPP